MERQRLTLDNPVFAGKLRYTHRSSAYVRRRLQPATIDDIVVARRPKPVPKHSGVTAVRVHAARSQAPAKARPHVAVLQPTSRKSVRRKRHVSHGRHMVLYAMAGSIFLLGVAVSLNGLRANKQVAAQVTHLQHEQSGGTDDATADTPPSTDRPSSNAVASYSVAPNLPRYIDIPKLQVHARVLSMGVDSKNQLRAPGNVFDAGWYNASAQPGQPGAMLVDGHISSWTTKGVFYGLNKLKAGDQIAITRGDNQKFTYTVVKTQTYDAKSVDMASLLVSQNTAKPGLNLISCSGDVIPGTSEFDKRIVVYAVMQ